MLKKNIATNEFGFIFNPATGDSYSSNATAAEVIQLMKEGKSLSEIKTSMLERYDVEKNVLEKDLDEFVVMLKQNNLLNN